MASVAAAECAAQQTRSLSFVEGDPLEKLDTWLLGAVLDLYICQRLGEGYDVPPCARVVLPMSKNPQETEPSPPKREKKTHPARPLDPSEAERQIPTQTLERYAENRSTQPPVCPDSRWAMRGTSASSASDSRNVVHTCHVPVQCARNSNAYVSHGEQSRRRTDLALADWLGTFYQSHPNGPTFARE